MTRLIILEGVGGAGKSTLAKALRRRGYRTIHCGFDETTTNLEAFYRDMLTSLAAPTVLDRSFISELVYGPVLRGRSRLARIIRKGSDFGSQDGVIVSRTKDRTLPLSSAGHVGRKIGRMARCERPAGQLRRGRSREAR